MGRRIDIELTSKLDDGRFTWRAAGAREPRGTLDAALVPSSATLGEVLRAEVESGIDGVDVLSIVPKKSSSPLDLRGEALQIIGPAREEPAVSVTLAPKGRGRRGESSRDGSRGASRDGRGPRRERDDRAPRSKERSTSGPRERPASGPRERPASGPRERPSGGPGDPAARPRRAGPPRDRAGQTEDRRGPGRREPAARGGAPTRRDARSNELPVSTVNRNALLSTLRAEQLPVAEQLLRGGLPAVRQAIDEQNRASLAQGRPTVAPETILTIADDLLPLTTLAAWKDRAAAVHQAGPNVRLRDLRPVVTAARAVTLDEEARGVLKELQGVLHAKTEELRTQWVSKIESLLGRDEVVEALHVVSRPPDQSTRCPSALATSLAEAAGRALNADLTATAWIAVLDAVVASPIRRTVHPAGIPAAEEAHGAAVRAAGHVPALAKLLGMRIPPPPPPAAHKRPALSARRSS